MTVAELSELRSLLKHSSLEYRIVKNTLAKIASRDTKISIADDVFQGPVGIAIGYDDPVLVVKKVFDFKRNNEKLQVKCAIVEGKFCEQNEIREIAELPSKEGLLSMLAGVFQAPSSKMAGALSATVRYFLYALEAHRNQKGD
jgi:large subunit ribosomal protein L10